MSELAKSIPHDVEPRIFQQDTVIGVKGDKLPNVRNIPAYSAGLICLPKSAASSAQQFVRLCCALRNDLPETILVALGEQAGYRILENWPGTIVYDFTKTTSAIIDNGDFQWSGESFFYCGEVIPETAAVMRRDACLHEVQSLFDALCGSPLLDPGGYERSNPQSKIVPLATFGHVDFSDLLLEPWRASIIAQQAEKETMFAEKLTASCHELDGQLALLHKVCTLWFRALSKHGVHFDTAAMPGRSSGEKITTTGKLLGIDSQVAALANGVPLEDVFSW